MKKIILLLLFVTGIVHAQNVNIPDVNFKLKLIALGIDRNSDEEIQVSEALAVTNLQVYNSNISSLTGIETFTNLVELNCGNNNISTLNVNGLVRLQTLICSYNNLTTLNISNLVNLDILYCQNNRLTQLDVSNQTLLTGLLCSTNNLTSLDVSRLTNLDHLVCGRNMLTSIDVSNNPLICSFGCSDMPSLNRINIKEGSSICLNNKQMYNNPNLRFVCVDQGEVLYFQNYFSTNGMPNVNVNTYCDFVPGGNFNTITGNVRFDAGNDGCGQNDVLLSMVKIKASQGGNDAIVYSGFAGDYSFYTSAGSFTVTPELENPLFFSVNPSNAVVNFADSNNHTFIQNFCVTANGIHPDIETVIVPVNNARPGFNAIYKIVYKNKGNQVLSGNIAFNYNDALLDYVSAQISPSSQNTGTITWDYSGLMPFESKSIDVVLRVNSPMDTPPVNLGNQLSFSVTANPVLNDETPVDNVFNYSQTVVGSFDPNDKQCLEGNSAPLSKIGDYLHYVVHFENTGTAAATNVVVRDVIDLSKFDIASLEVLSATHPIIAKVAGNKVEFIFENILLGASAQGNIVFKIKTKNNLTSGDVVTNKADIFFDYNFPVVTNVASTVFQALGINDVVWDNSVKVFPNPARDSVDIKSARMIKSIQLFDAQGRLLLNKITNQTNDVLELQTKPSGLYFVKVFTEDGLKIEKVIKE
ncbi:MAG TPA: T9SS type A sorting domain-containing protein [Flavobacterium sp.]|nr:T9SS type A sorting domain-containing protein [Flavobacterium sp.]